MDPEPYTPITPQWPIFYTKYLSIGKKTPPETTFSIFRIFQPYLAIFRAKNGQNPVPLRGVKKSKKIEILDQKFFDPKMSPGGIWGLKNGNFGENRPNGTNFDFGGLTILSDFSGSKGPITVQYREGPHRGQNRPKMGKNRNFRKCPNGSYTGQKRQNMPKKRDSDALGAPLTAPVPPPLPSDGGPAPLPSTAKPPIPRGTRPFH